MLAKVLYPISRRRALRSWAAAAAVVVLASACLARPALSAVDPAFEGPVPDPVVAEAQAAADDPVVADPVPFVLGTSVYQMLDFPLTDIDWYMGQLKAAGGNALEIFLHRSWPARLQDKYSIGARASIYKRVGEKKDPRFPGFKFPVFDLDQWDEANLAKLQEVFQFAAGHGLKLIIRIHDQFSRKTPLDKQCYPYDACLQAQGYAGGPGMAWLLDEAETDPSGRPTARYYMRRENDKLLEMARASGTDVSFCIMSEADYARVGDVPREEMERRLIAFHEFYFDDLTAKGVAPGQILVSFKKATFRMKADPKWAEAVFEIHGCNSPQVLQRYYNLYGPLNFFPNGDGPDPNALGLVGTIGTVTREPSVSQARQMRRLILANNGWGWCTWNRNVEKRWPADIRRANFQIIKALAGLI